MEQHTHPRQTLAFTFIFVILPLPRKVCLNQRATRNNPGLPSKETQFNNKNSETQPIGFESHNVRNKLLARTSELN